MRLKIHGGTTKGESLCEGCTFFRRRVLQNGTVTRHCSRDYNHWRPIEYKVVECNDFYATNAQNLNDMYKQAWYLRTNSSGQSIGFMRRNDFVAKFGESEADKGLE